MKRIMGMVLLAAFLVPIAGCSSYASIATQGDKAVVVKNGAFFGAFRSVLVCDNTERGLENCQEGDVP